MIRRLLVALALALVAIAPPVVLAQPTSAAPTPSQYIGTTRQWAGRCSVASWWNTNGTMTFQVMTPAGTCSSLRIYTVVAGKTVYAYYKSYPGPNTLHFAPIPITPAAGCFHKLWISDAYRGITNIFQWTLFSLPKQVG